MEEYDLKASEDMLYMLLDFEEGLEEVNIITAEKMEYDGWFFNAMLFYGDGSRMEVPFVYYEGNDWLFTPCDWQEGDLPKHADEAGRIDWRVDDTETEGFDFDGQPVLAPWVPEMIEARERKERRERRQALGERLRKAREEAGMSQRDAASATGIDQGVISRTEAGRANTTIDTVMTLCEAYGKDLIVGELVPYFDSEEAFAEHLKREREKEK